MQQVSWNWFGAKFESESEEKISFIQPFVGLCLGSLVLYFSTTLGVIILTISSILIGTCMLAPGVFLRLQYWMQKFGEFIGYSLAVIILTPLYLVIFTLIHIFSRIQAYDPLKIRSPAVASSYWQLADSDHRKRKWIRRMFATDNLVAGGYRGSSILGFLTSCFLILVVTEVFLRILGFGSPVLYVNDPTIGYLPLPQQSVVRYGGKVKINQFGMRSKNVESKKPVNTLRIFMLGDSTLYGGSYVDQNDIYASQLEHCLSEQLTCNVEVLSMGVNAWGPFHKLGYVKQRGTYDSDIAMVCLPIGDIFRPLSHLETGGPFHLAHEPPGTAIAEIFLAGRQQINLILNKNKRLPDDELESQGKLGIAAYRDLVNTLEKKDCEVFVEVLPSKFAGMAQPGISSPDQDLVDQLKTGVGRVAAFGYPTGLFHGEEPSQIYSDVCHLDIKGHTLYAKYLADELIRKSKRIQSFLKSSLNTSEGTR